MAFDFDAVLNDPRFQQGIGFLGAGMQSKPLMQAFEIMRQMEADKQAKAQAAQQQAQAQQMMQYRNAQMKQAEEHSKLYASQVEQQTRKNTLQEQQQNMLKDAVSAFVEARRAGRAPSATPPMQMQPQAAPMQPSMETGKYGTPKFILDNLEQVESSGNPLAIGPDIGGGVKALGSYQFLPSTIAMLKKQGITFDPFKRFESRDAADFYLQSLFKQHGGDWEKALAAYGGFKSKDATSYVNKVLNGSNEKNAKQMQQLQAARTQQVAPNPFADHQENLEFAGLVRALSGDVGGLKDLADASKPTVVQPGSFVASGQSMTQVPDPKGDREYQLKLAENQRQEEELRLKNRGVKVEESKEERLTREGKLEVDAKTAKVTAQYDMVAAAADRMEKGVKELIDHPGRKAATGASGLANPLFLFGDRKTFLAKMKTTASQLVNDTLQAVRNASENGASGYGQFTVQELEVIKSYIANLDPTMNEDEFLKGLNNIAQYAQETKQRSQQLARDSVGKPVERSTSGPLTIKRTGRDKDGKKVIEYSDGSIVHAN